MGTGAEAVVTPRLQVRGLEGLRVADASVMPTVPSCNTQAPTVMVGERVADFIRADQEGAGRGSGRGFEAVQTAAG